MSRHVVVTGAGGFVGGVVAHTLARRGARVTAISRSARGPDAANLTWHQADLMAPDALPRAFDAVIHCAAELPARCPDLAQLYARNLTPARNVFAQAQAAGASCVVFLSSMAVYGTITVPLATEQTPPQAPDPYGRAKHAAEQLLEAAVAQGLASGLAIRLPGTVGRGSHDNFLSNILAGILRGEDVAARNPDAAFNNVVYAGDLAEFLAGWIVNPRDGYHVTNLAAQDPMTIRDAVELLARCSGRSPRITFAPGTPSYLIALDQARSLGYRPGTVRGSIEAFVRDSVAP